MAAVPAPRPAAKAAVRRAVPSSAQSRPAAEAIDAAVVSQWWPMTVQTPCENTAQATASSAARGRFADERRAAA